MREFVTAAAAAAQTPEDDTYGFETTLRIDGREVVFKPLTSSQISLVIAAMQGDLFRKVSTVINFFFSMVKESEDKAWFEQRLWDTEDAFGAPMMEEIMKGLIEEWGARPTQSASPSSGSPQETGRTSTAKRHSKASTRSASPSSAS